MVENKLKIYKSFSPAQFIEFSMVNLFLDGKKKNGGSGSGGDFHRFFHSDLDSAA